MAARYRIERCLGSGGMGVVYRARHLTLGRMVALKVLDRGLEGSQWPQRFEREARTSALLDHAACVRVFDYGRTVDGDHFLAMELIEGPTLSAVLARVKRFPVSHAVRVVAELLGALEHAHGLGILHRDVKPENLLLARDAQGDVSLKLIDFGLAKALDPAEHDQLTLEVSLLGTLGYLAPERIRDPADADIRGEVYAVGAIGYFLLTGEEWLPNLESAAPEEAPPVGARRRLDTPGLEAIIARALRHRKSVRWESCRSLAEALAACRP